VVWLVMLAEGLLDEGSVPGLEAKRERMGAAAAGKPRVLEVVHREVVGPDDEFVMNEGWRSFQPVACGEVVAHGRAGPLRSPFTGLMLLPRYQGQGEDGFFVARPVRRGWLRASAVARWLRLDRALPLVPGVVRDPNDAAALVARGVAARWLAPQLFHLFGYRRSRASADGRVSMRRQPDDVGLRPLPKPAAAS
jgi:hypothetical protein